MILVLVLVTTGCNRRGKFGTVLPGRSAGVTDEGLAGQGARPNQGNRGDSVPPITNTGIPTPIPVDGLPVDPSGTERPIWDSLIPDASKFAAQTVYFDFDKDNVKPGEVEKIRVVASHLKANATHRVQVDGHCDERGTEEYNRALGEKRALAIREFLVREGVEPERVRTVSYGEDKPVDTGHSESAWAKNRRGEFILMTPPSTL
ncbi:MAG: peptidoglycan-associated lipoprotein Pal [Verrucomicrobia bacterium]|nr:peptidoglycan-associated lipoprotein Pal [Verrucomicrobiota bacterium]